MGDLANLQIRVQSLEAELATARLNKLERSGAKAERATDGLTASFKKFAGPAVAAAAAVATLTKVVSVTREFEVLNARLITATGNAENAAVAFTAIQDFASETPFDLGQVTTAFTKLVNLGLTPSEEALTSYGNTASAMGKDLNQLIEAVADASTGEFERLKEFGIKSKSQGDQVSFTFRGITTTVGKNAAEIEGYLQALGDNEFSGAMLERMNTLDGAISNLGDEWTKFFTNVSNLGVGSVIEDGVRGAIDILTDLNFMLASGQTEAALDAIGMSFDGFGSDITTTLGIITKEWNDFLGTPEGEGIAGATKETMDAIIKAFKEMPEDARALIQLFAVELAAIIDFGAQYGEAFGVVLGSEFAKIVEKSKAYGTAIAQAINPFDDNSFNLEAELRSLDNAAAEIADEAFARAEKQVAFSREARRESIAGILEERDATIKAVDEQIKEIERLGVAHKKDEAARKAAGDVLGQFKVGGKKEGDGEQESKSEIKAREARETALENLRKSLRTEEEVIQESYDNRLAIILSNTEEGSIQQAELKRRLDEDFATQAVGDLNTVDTYEEQLQGVNDFYERRRALILENVNLTEEERTALEEELTAQRNERLAILEAERMASVLSNSANLFGSLSDLAKDFAGEQSGIYKAMFAVSKAFSIAEAVVKIQAGLANAAATPFPANLGAISSVAAATSGIVSTITGTNFSGAMDAGGTIPQGKIGLVGEFGPELVAGPANVRSRRDTAEMFKGGKEKEAAPVAPPQVNVRNINVLDPTVVGDYLGTDEGEQLIMNVVQRNQRAIGF